MSGEALALKIDLKRLALQHNITPAPFTPLALLPSVDHDTVVQGYAAPATVDRDLMKFAARCWMPIEKEIPLLFRHDHNHPAGTIEEIRVDDQGLYVRARINHSDAKRCPYFSVAATVRSYQIRQADDRDQCHGLITCATLDEISLVPDNPGNPAALVQRPPPPVAFYDLAKSGVQNIMKMLDVIATQAATTPVKADHAPHSISSAPRPVAQPRVEPHRATSFGQLVTAMERNHHVGS